MPILDAATLQDPKRYRIALAKDVVATLRRKSGTLFFYKDYKAPKESSSRRALFFAPPNSEVQAELARAKAKLQFKAAFVVQGDQVAVQNDRMAQALAIFIKKMAKLEGVMKLPDGLSADGDEDTLGESFNDVGTTQGPMKGPEAEHLQRVTAKRDMAQVLPELQRKVVEGIEKLKKSTYTPNQAQLARIRQLADGHDYERALAPIESLIPKAGPANRVATHKLAAAKTGKAVTAKISTYEPSGGSASGSGGEVHFLKSWDTEAPAIVVKTPLKHGDIAKMEREAAIYEKVGPHPNIATVFGVREIAGKTGLVMESITGGDMSENFKHMNRLVQQGKMSEEQYWGAMQFTIMRTLEAVEHIEKMGVVHHDIKAPNLMLDERTGEPKVIDFGTSTGAGEPGRGTTGHHPSDGDDARASGKTDVFGVGGMAYEVREGNDGTKSNMVFDYGVGNIWGFETDMKAKAFELAEKEALSVAPNGAVQPGEAGSASKKKGVYAAKTAYVDFVNKLMHPNPAKRLSPTEALNHPFLQDRMLDDDNARDVLKGVAGGRKGDGAQRTFELAQKYCDDKFAGRLLVKLEKAKQGQVAELLEELLQHIRVGRKLHAALSVVAGGRSVELAAEAQLKAAAVSRVVYEQEQQLADSIADDIPGLGAEVWAEGKAIRSRRQLAVPDARQVRSEDEALQDARAYCERHVDADARISKLLGAIERERKMVKDAEEGKRQAVARIQVLAAKNKEASDHGAKLIESLRLLAKAASTPERHDELAQQQKEVLAVKTRLDNARP